MTDFTPQNRGVKTLSEEYLLSGISENEDGGTACEAGPPQFVGKNSRMLEVWDLVNQVADTDATVLIAGESGTGKELVARALHEKSSRRLQPFVAVNCGAIAETLEESELFGHVKGAFTGASTCRKGKFETAQGGTIFLDEIDAMSKTLQVKLLRILQSGEYSPVGSAETRHCEVRVVAATNRDLLALIAAGEFRQDLYYRLNILRLELPPLRERRSDIPLLIAHFLRVFSLAYRKSDREYHLQAEAEATLLHYEYPGNVRELENIIKRAVILSRDECISLQHLPRETLVERGLLATSEPANFHQAKARVVEEFEKSYLTSILSACGGIVSRAANRSGLSEHNFHEKLKKYGICGRHYRAE